MLGIIVKTCQERILFAGLKYEFGLIAFFKDMAEACFPNTNQTFNNDVIWQNSAPKHKTNPPFGFLKGESMES